MYRKQYAFTQGLQMAQVEEKDAPFILSTGSLCKMPMLLHSQNHEKRDQSSELFKRFTAAFVEINVLEKKNHEMVRR